MNEEDAASWGSTPWGDDLDYCQSADPFHFNGAENPMPQGNPAPPVEWTQHAMVPAIFVAYPVLPTVAVNPPETPTPACNDGFQGPPAESLSPANHVRTDPVKKGFLKQNAQDRKRRPLVVKQKENHAASRALPEASEEDWQRRLQKRHNIVAATKETPEYRAFSSASFRARRAALRTPSPNDRSVSKRQWEEKIHKWRTALRNWNAAAAWSKSSPELICNIIHINRGFLQGSSHTVTWQDTAIKRHSHEKGTTYERTPP